MEASDEDYSTKGHNAVRNAMHFAEICYGEDSDEYQEIVAIKKLLPKV